MSDTDPRDRDVLRRVYEDQMRELRPQLAAALDLRTQTDLELTDARRRHVTAVAKHANIQGRVDALRDLAAKDGIHLE